jgi:hypothetical protein
MGFPAGALAADPLGAGWVADVDGLQASIPIGHAGIVVCQRHVVEVVRVEAADPLRLAGLLRSRTIKPPGPAAT